MYKKLAIIDNRAYSEQRPYYLAQLPQKKFKKLRAKARIIEFRPCRCCNTYCPGEQPGRFTKEAIERFPKYLRRGEEYGN